MKLYIFPKVNLSLETYSKNSEVNEMADQQSHRMSYKIVKFQKIQKNNWINLKRT